MCMFEVVSVCCLHCVAGGRACVHTCLRPVGLGGEKKWGRDGDHQSSTDHDPAYRSFLFFPPLFFAQRGFLHGSSGHGIDFDIILSPLLLLPRMDCLRFGTSWSCGTFFFCQSPLSLHFLMSNSFHQRCRCSCTPMLAEIARCIIYDLFLPV